MFIFHSELTLTLYILLSAVIFAAVQLLLCRKVRRRAVACIRVLPDKSEDCSTLSKPFTGAILRAAEASL